jgi:hypothetical protein
MSRIRLTAALLAPSAIALGGCGGGETFTTDRPILKLTVDEYRIVPQDIVAIPPNGRIKIVVRNTGRLTHNLVVQIPPKEADDKPEPVPGARVISMQPGEAALPIKVALPPGEYRLVCTIANHDDLGQYGKLVVKAPSR